MSNESPALPSAKKNLESLTVKVVWLVVVVVPATFKFPVNVKSLNIGLAEEAISCAVAIVGVAPSPLLPVIRYLFQQLNYLHNLL